MRQAEERGADDLDASGSGRSFRPAARARVWVRACLGKRGLPDEPEAVMCSRQRSGRKGFTAFVALRENGNDLLR